ncbi:MAG: hypothetical protein FJ025_03420, partial [Chloroflexi bacterium]|nr:hypothetical protein [Chloroflexota bacterium]
IVVIAQPAAILAQEEQPQEQTLELSTKYPKIEVTSGISAEFEVDLKLTGDIGDEPVEFALAATAPKDWGTMITPSYPKDKIIASIQLQPGFTMTEKILVKAAPAYWLTPDPGEYPVTLNVTAENVSGSIVLTVVITAKYTLKLAPAAQGLYSTKATAGKDNFYSIEAKSSGSAAVDNINLSSTKPEGWAVDFSPSKIDSLAAGDSQTIDVNIKPPPNTIAGDYLVTLKATGNQASAQDIDIRVTVETPTVWGWVGVIIVVVVIAGLVYTFRRFSRR